MAARNRMPPWHENVRLSNGRDVLIRPIRPEDAVPLRAGFALLQPDEVRQRFLHPMKELSADQAERLTRPNARREFALVAHYLGAFCAQIVLMLSPQRIVLGGGVMATPGLIERVQAEADLAAQGGEHFGVVGGGSRELYDE